MATPDSTPKASPVSVRTNMERAVLDATATPPADRATLLAIRPGLLPWFSALDAARAALLGMTLDAYATHQRDLARYEAMTPEDLLPRPQEQPLHTPLGEFAAPVWRMYCALGNVTALPDLQRNIDEAITRLTTAFAELEERLALPAVAGPQPAPILVVEPRRDEPPPKAILHFNPLDFNPGKR